MEEKNISDYLLQKDIFEFEAVLELAREQKVKRLEWQVLAWNEPALNFYKKYQSVVDNEWLNCRITDKQLQGL